MAISQQPLHSGQVDVRQWVADGCPPGRWTGFTYKTTAIALASRRLITISKKGGNWQASLLPAGRYYLDHDGYPAGHWPIGRGAKQLPDIPPARPASTDDKSLLPRVSLVKRRRPKQVQGTDESTPTRQLVKDIVDAGGMLERTSRTTRRTTRALSGSDRRGFAPDGQQVLMSRGQTHNSLILRFEPVSNWQTTQPRDVIAAERVGKWHPVIAELRNDYLKKVPAPVRQRCFRLLHCLAREAEARGYEVRPIQKDRNGFQADRDGLRGSSSLLSAIRGVRCGLSSCTITFPISPPRRNSRVLSAKPGSGSRSPTAFRLIG
ncbi:hypothetical protein [Williamsia sp.]|uniref:hypothetical protein n=1 Tax=Williamsia sp. TaxID=1872085 RepID=UPI002F943508